MLLYPCSVPDCHACNTDRLDVSAAIPDSIIWNFLTQKIQPMQIRCFICKFVTETPDFVANKQGCVLQLFWSFWGHWMGREELISHPAERSTKLHNYNKMALTSDHLRKSQQDIHRLRWSSPSVSPSQWTINPVSPTSNRTILNLHVKRCSFHEATMNIYC